MPTADRPTIFEAARTGDVRAVRDHLDTGADVSALDAHGFTALQSAALGANTTPVAQNLAVLRLLVRAGSPLEQRGRDGRTALFLAAEFAPSTDAVRLLLEAGAQADVATDAGRHVLDDAMAPEVVELLARVTGRAVPQAVAEPEPVRLRAGRWRTARARVAAVFETLAEAGLVALQDAGDTQEDGFAECAEAYRKAGGAAAGLLGFCYCTRQDTGRAKRSGRLPLAFWGAPNGEPSDLARVGELVVRIFREHGFRVDWDGSGGSRPVVDLRGGA